MKCSTKRGIEMLPPPKDPNFTIERTAEQFFNPKDGEDEDLLATGEWDDDELLPTDEKDEK
jgi:hypothetical protein